MHRRNTNPGADRNRSNAWHELRHHGKAIAQYSALDTRRFGHGATVHGLPHTALAPAATAAVTTTTAARAAVATLAAIATVFTAAFAPF